MSLALIWMRWAWRWIARSGVWLAGGMVAMLLLINISAGPGVVIRDQSEAEGPQFSDASTLDIVSQVRRNRVCPSTTQRWVWRRTTYEGKPAQQAVPLASTDLPFLADNGTLILTIPAPGVPDPENGGWFYRSITAEHCSFLPEWLGSIFGPRLFRSADIPVNFVGESHTEGH